MELLYHYLWQNRMMGMPLHLSDGTDVSIVSPGVHNENAGPDFSGARLRFGEQEWAGNVEIHVKASDWYRHGHDHDRAYDSVILHLVGVGDAEVFRPDGSVIPQAVATVPRGFFGTYNSLTSGLKGVRCTGMLRDVPELLREDWLETLAIERLQEKARRVMDYRREFNDDLEQAVFVTLARALGFGLNGLPFEMLARSLPLKYVFHHSDDKIQIEALIFGQAGMLDPTVNIFDEYYQTLCREYAFLMHKYGLSPMRRDLWKYSRTRPGNFPHRRMALLAEALAGGRRISAGLLDANADYDRLSEFLNWELKGYWASHGDFGDFRTDSKSGLSVAAKESLMINLAVPFYHAYSALTGDPEIAERAAVLMTELAPERNTYITAWNMAGLKADSALRSQALIQLRREYCDRERCRDCRFARYFLRRELSPLPDSMLSPHVSPPEPEVKHGVLIALDSFKGCLSSRDAGEALAAGLVAANPDVDVEVVAVADGGEGMADAIGDSRGLPRIRTNAVDPLMRPLECTYVHDPNIRTAFIDMASATGLTLLTESERSPLHTTTFGVGMLMRSAIKRGCRQIVLGLGGSATNDAGIGALQALGARVRLKGEDGWLRRAVTGEDLVRIEEISLDGSEAMLSGTRIMLACDVRSPFCGQFGAVNVFASQKGADARARRILEKGMGNIRDYVIRNCGIDLNTVEGAGAAGGMAGGMLAFAGGEIFSGAEVVAHCIGLDSRIADKSLVITGEGSADGQTLTGKLPLVVRRMAARHRVPTIIVAGRVESIDSMMSAGFADAIDINAGYPKDADEDPMDPETARKRLAAIARKLLLKLPPLK